MKKNNLDETEIEHLLKEMPSFKDSRSRDEIYQAVKKAEGGKKSKTWGYPALAAIAAVLILALITPSIFNSFKQPGYENSASDMAVEESAESGSAQKKFGDIQDKSFDAGSAGVDEAENHTEQSSMLNAAAVEKINVYEEDLQQYDVFTFGLAAPDAFAVPVSVLVKKQESDDWLGKFEEVSGEIPETAWGFNEYLPLPGSFIKDEETNELVYTVSKEEQENLSSGSEDLLYDSISMSLETSVFEKIRLKTPEGSVPTFSHLGEISEIKKPVDSNNGYYKYTLENGEVYLVPGEETYETIEDALGAMKTSPGSFYEPVIAKDIEISLTAEGSNLTVSFNEGLTLEDTLESRLLIEGILMSAKEFDFKAVLFDNIESPQMKDFDFSRPVPVPVGPNKKVLN
ncbi:hypothetical protein D3H55_22325 [Bacillus salacetis]|uniref:Sigma-X negative effector n=1 Tax=Bacillus salacetis TaxID=2315464 RepID=A0A3A1QN62_9BACI|nr:hypothetical protein [Bacillus salacetis]RIW27994.1 hypothetical protein D3H55_22325 [Bacillus salacetis]